MSLLRRKDSGNMELIMKRREFLSFFLLGGLAGLLKKKTLLKKKDQPKKAMFWRKA